MGKQSSRIYYQGQDHKDIYFQGHYHDAMYIGDKLVWKKLFMGTYVVVGQNKIFIMDLDKKKYQQVNMDTYKGVKSICTNGKIFALLTSTDSIIVSDNCYSWHELKDENPLPASTLSWIGNIGNTFYAISDNRIKIIEFDDLTHYNITNLTLSHSIYRVLCKGVDKIIAQGYEEGTYYLHTIKDGQIIATAKNISCDLMTYGKGVYAGIRTKNANSFSSVYSNNGINWNVKEQKYNEAKSLLVTFFVLYSDKFYVSIARGGSSENYNVYSNNGIDYFPYTGKTNMYPVFSLYGGGMYILQHEIYETNSYELGFSDSPFYIPTDNYTGLNPLGMINSGIFIGNKKLIK